MAPADIVLRPARAEECRRVFEWASDPETRAASFHPAPIPYGDHERWYAGSLASAGRHLRIAEAGGAAVGLVRLDRMEEDQAAAEIGINIAPEHRGAGLATPMLLAARTEAATLGFARVVARIRPGNERSIRAFERAGFAFVASERVAGADARRYEAPSRSATPPLVVRADAGPRDGAGHFMRCLALAEHWRDEGGDVTFAGSWPGELDGLLEAEGVRSVDADAMLETLSGSAAAVIDGYGFDRAYHDRIAAKAACTLVIDDVGHLPEYGGDLLLNANLGASRIAYPAAPPARLLGPAFALLRRSLRALRGRTREVAPSGRNVLLALGGGDRLEDWRAVLEALASGTEEASFRLVPGFAAAQRADVERLAAAAGSRFRPAGPAEAAELMAWADLAVSAAGVTALELAFLGVPAILVSVAENQRPTAAALAGCGAAVDLGRSGELHAETLRSTVIRLLASPSTRRDMSERGREVLDGRGVERVAAAIRGRLPAQRRPS